MQLWAHRGAGKGLLENTIQGFQLALQHGFSAIEFDVMLTADGVPMVHHDWAIGRCVKPIAAAQPVEPYPSFQQLNLKDLKAYTVGGQAIPSLQDVVEFCLQHGLQANVELKATNPRNALALGMAVLMQIEQQRSDVQRMIQQQWVFSSFYHASLLPLRGLNLALLYTCLPDDWTLHANALGVRAVHLEHKNLNEAHVRRIHSTGRKVRVFTVNNIKVAKCMKSLGVAGIFTDNMGLQK